MLVEMKRFLILCLFPSSLYSLIAFQKVTKVAKLLAMLPAESATIQKSDATISECELSTEGTVNCEMTSTTVSKSNTTASVWTTFGELAAATSSSNLGQGFPDWPPPQFVRDALRDTVDSTFHQYTRPAGHPPLIKLLAERYSMHLNRPIDAFEEIAVTVGASQALYLALRIFLTNPEDEVVVFEPFFDVSNIRSIFIQFDLFSIEHFFF